MKDNFEWTDELVMQFVEFHEVQKGLHWTSEDIYKFKKSKESTIHEWEVVSFFDTYKNVVRWQGQGEHCGLMYKEWVDMALNNNYPIHSVRRLSDGVEFKIGDRICSKVNIPNSFTIEKIHIINQNFIYLDSCPLENAFHLGKEPKALFTTEDQVDVYEGRKYFLVNQYTFEWHMENALKHGGGNLSSDYKTFAFLDNARNYITENKPIQVSYKELHDYLKDNWSSGLIEFFKSKINP